MSEPKRPYACPHCKQAFTKWGLCQTHLRQNVECREALGDATVDELQELCRTAVANVAVDQSRSQVEHPEQPMPAAAVVDLPASDPVSDLKIDPCPPGLSSMPAMEVDLPVPSDQSLVSPKHANRVSSSVNKRVSRAVQFGYLTEPESIELEDKFDDLAACSDTVQEEVMEKFFSLGIGDLRWVIHKGDWLLRCVQFCLQPTSPDEQHVRQSHTQVHLLLEALAAHSLKREALSPECWDHFAELEPEVRINVCEAMKNGILVNVTGSLSEHFMHVCRNERIIVDLEKKPKPKVDLQQDVLEWDALDGSLYKNVVQQIIFKRRNSEEDLLRSAAQMDQVPEPGTIGSLLATHTATSAARQQCSADAMSALHAAAAGGLARICARLIAEGLDIDELAGCQQTTALHLAAIHGEVKVVRLLLLKRADVNALDGENQTPLFRAVQTAAQLGKHEQGSNAASMTHLSLQQSVCRSLLSAGAVSSSEGEHEAHGSPLSPEHLAGAAGLISLRNVIRLFKRLHNMRSKFEFDESSIDSLLKLQYETAMFTIGVFDQHMAVDGDAACMEFHALIDSVFISDRDKLQKIGNRLHKKVPAWTKKCSDALVDLPLEAGELAINTLSFEEVSPHVFSLDLPKPRPPPPPPLPAGVAGGDGNGKGNNEDDDNAGANSADKVESINATIPAQEMASNGVLTQKEPNEHVDEAGPPSSQLCAPGFGEPTGREPELSQKYLAHLRGPKVQELARERRQDNEAFFRIIGVRQRGGRRDDALRKKEIDRRIALLLQRETTPLWKDDFDFRVRRFLLEFSVHSTAARASEALVHVENSTAGKSRDEVRSWPAYLATLLRRFDPKLYEALVERDRRSRAEPRRGAEGWRATGGAPEPTAEAEGVEGAEGAELLGDEESLHSSDVEDDENQAEAKTTQHQQPGSGSAAEPPAQAVRPYHLFQ